MDWSFATSLKSRAAVDTAPHVLALLKAAGLKVTTNAGVSVVVTPSATPLESGDFVSASLTRFEGSGLGVMLAETLRGCVAKALSIKGGNSELLATFTGAGIGKTEARGRLDSITVLIGALSLTITAEESYRLTPGYYLCEAEIIQVTAVTPGATTATIVRGALASTAAAHAAVPMVPYRPPTVTFVGSPIAEPVSTVTLGGIALRCRSWSIDITTGLDLLEPETGSKYSQGAKATRYDAKVSLQLVLSGDQVSLLGKATARPNLALSIVQGTGVGGIVTIAAPNCEVVPFVTPDTNNDIAVVDVTLRLRDGASTGNDMFTLTLT
jgi:hypothetical protein